MAPFRANGQFLADEISSAEKNGAAKKIKNARGNFPGAARKK